MVKSPWALICGAVHLAVFFRLGKFYGAFRDRALVGVGDGVGVIEAEAVVVFVYALRSVEAEKAGVERNGCAAGLDLTYGLFDLQDFRRLVMGGEKRAGEDKD